MNIWPDRVDQAALDRAVEAITRRQPVVVVGRQGIGKTTFARAAVHRAGRQAVWLVGGPGRTAAIDAVLELPGSDSVDDQMRAAADELTSARAVLIVENIGALDPGSRAIVTGLGASGRVPVILVSRAGSEGAASTEAAQGLGTDCVVELTPLDRFALADVVEEYLGGRLTSATVTRLLQLSGGVPFRLRHIVEGSVADGLLTEDRGRWRFGGGVGVTVVLRSAIDTELARWPTDSLAALRRVAAAFPETADGCELHWHVPAVAAAVAPAPDLILGATGRLAVETIRHDMGPLERLSLGRSVLPSLAGDPAVQLAVRARLAVEIGERVEPAELLAASRSALLDAVPGTASWLAAAATARNGGDSDDLVDGWCAVLRGSTTALRTVAVAARAAGARSDAVVAELLEAAIAEDWAGVLTLVRGSAGVADDHLAALFLVAEAECLRVQGQLARASALIESVSRRELPRLIAVVGTERTRIAVDLAAGRPDVAYERGNALLDDGLPGGLVDVAVLPDIIDAALQTGHLDQAWRLASDAFESADRPCPSTSESRLIRAAAGRLIRVLTLLGRHDDAAAVRARCADRLDADAWSRQIDAWSLIGAGRLIRPMTALRDAASSARRSGQVLVAADLLHQSVELGDREAARRLSDGAHPGEGVRLTLQRGHARALLAGRVDGLDAVADDMERHGYLAAALTARAQAVSALRRSGRRAEAERRCDELRVLRAACGDPLTPALFDVDTGSRLTVREREVHAAVRSGATTADIAADLGVTPETVMTHRARVRSKLRADDAS